MQGTKRGRALVLSLLVLSGSLVAGSQVSAKSRPSPAVSLERSQQQKAGAFSSAATPSCRALPTAATSAPDDTGRLWGSSNGAACAFKDAAGRALFYTSYEPGSWLHTPACSMPAFSDNSVADSKLRTWGWEISGSLCAFKDDQQLPIPQQRTYIMLSWQEAPACKLQPAPTADNAAADKFGCLWGWQLDRNCAFRDLTGQPLYYKGDSGKCDAAGNAKRAADFNARLQNHNDGRTTPGGVTGLGCIGQKSSSQGAGSAPCIDTTVPVNFGPGPA